MNQISGAMGKGAPPMPDYKGAVEAQTLANRPNQVTPWASSTWTSGKKAGGGDGGGWHDGQYFLPGGGRVGGGGPGDAGRDTQTVSLAGPLDAANTSMMDQFASAWKNPLDNGQQARQHAEDAIYQRASSRLDPMWASREHDMATTLANQGIDPNSAAYAKASDNLGRNRNDAYTSALMEAITGGGQEASWQQQLDLTSRFAPMQGMAGIKSLSGMPNVPGAGNDLAAAIAQGQYGMDAAKMNQQNMSDLIRGGISIAALSDERVKDDITRHAEEILPGVPLASFRYKWEPAGTRHLGVIAQDLEAKHPELVTYRNGYRFVPARFLLT